MYSFACTSLDTLDEYLLSAFGNGTISIYNLKKGKKMIDIAAHARWIHSISVKNNLLASVSEDCYLRIWQLNEINNQFEVLINFIVILIIKCILVTFNYF